MLETVSGGQGVNLIIAVAVVSVALLALVAILWLMRARASSTFIRGGRNRQPRLAVLDAAAVDTRRRLVLVRRDDVEHLLMIGGPSDVVIESRIVAPASAPGQETGTETTVASRPVPRKTGAAPVPQAHPQPAAASPATPAPVAPLPDPEPPIHEEKPASDPIKPRLLAGMTGPVAALGGLAAAAAARPSAPEPSTQGAGDAESARAEASGIFEAARARVFSGATEPSPPPYVSPFDAPAPSPGEDHSRDAQPEPSPAPPESAAVSQNDNPWDAQQADDVIPDFEAVLAEELSEDFDIDPDSGGYIAAGEPSTPSQAYAETLEPGLSNDFDSDLGGIKPERDDGPAPPANDGRDRNSLEAEMERLLGDLTRR